jgi:Lrp/AsnC family transcriptional regulator
MEDVDVIRGRVALIEPDVAGFGLLVFVMIRKNGHAAHWLLKFEESVSAMPKVLGAHRMSGKLSYIL